LFGKVSQFYVQFVHEVLHSIMMCSEQQQTDMNFSHKLTRIIQLAHDIQAYLRLEATRPEGYHRNW